MLRKGTLLFYNKTRYLLICYKMVENIYFLNVSTDVFWLHKGKNIFGAKYFFKKVFFMNIFITFAPSKSISKNGIN